MRRFLVPWIVLGLAVAGVSDAVARERWTRVDTSVATIYSNGEPGRARHVARTLEEFRAVVTKLRLGLAAVEFPPIDVVLLSDASDVARLAGTEGISLLRFHRGTEERCLVVVAEGDRALPRLIDEYVGHLLHAAGGKVPRWYREGLGDYYATFTLDRGEYLVGLPAGRYRVHLEYEGSVPLEQILDRWGGRRTDAASTPTAWGFVHFLLSSDLLRDRTAAFVAATGGGEKGADASPRTLGEPLATIESRFHDYMREYELPSIRIPRGEVAPEEPRATTVLDKENVRALLDRVRAAVASLAPAEPATGPALAEEIPRTRLVPRPREPERVRLTAAQVAPSVPAGGWLRLATPHFRIWSNAGGTLTRKVALQLEEMLVVVDRVAGGLGDLGEPLDAYVFATKEELGGYVAGFPAGLELAGYYAVRGDRSALLVLGEALAQQRVSVVYHELAHHLTYRRCGGCPAWFHEGLAEYYSTLRVEGKTAQVGRSLDPHVQRLLSSGGRGVTEVLRPAAVPPHRLEAEASAAFYARAWGLVNFLLSTGRTGRDGLSRLLASAEQGEPPETAVLAAFGTEIGVFDQAIADYYRSRLFLPFVTVPLDDVVFPEIGEPTPAPPAVLQERLGSLAWLTLGPDRPDAVLGPYQAAIAADPAYAPAHAGLAGAFALLERPDEAAAAWERALSLAPDDPRVARDAGVFQASRLLAESGTGDPKESAERSRRARSLIERWLPDHPADAEALFAYGSMWIFDEGDPSPGVAALEASLASDPKNVAARFNVLSLTVRLGDRSRSEAAFQAFAALDADPEHADRAHDLVLLHDIDAARAAFEARKPEQALSILRRAQQRARTAEMKDRLATIVGELEKARR